MTTRLYFIVARAAPTAVVFRRGPSRQVELLRWDLATDRVVPGQWLKGRIYERRCDLSPNGELLIYFAAKYETKMRTWTAISRPPFLTALALWSKGDASGGGGLFDSDRTIRLNHRPDEMRLEEDFRLAPSMKVEGFGPGSGWGEDDPLHDARLIRDGWRFEGEGSAAIENAVGSSPWIEFRPPIKYRRPIGGHGGRVALEMTIEGLRERDGSWYLTRFAISDGHGVVRDLGRADWADVAPDGDLLLAQDGRLLRFASSDLANNEPTVIGDLNGHVFEEREAPPSLRSWPGEGVSPRA